jgi:hypothetical protein
MAGLTFGTILTMVLLPVLYAILYRIPSPKPAKAEKRKLPTRLRNFWRR